MHFILSGREKKKYPHHGEPLLVIGMRWMPPSWGADRIGVSLGSHRPTVILKLPCLVEKKRTKVRSLAVLFSAANWDRSPARSDWSKNLLEHITHIRGQGAERPLDLLTAAQE
jgi:hypothetical protein